MTAYTARIALVFACVSLVACGGGGGGGGSPTPPAPTPPAPTSFTVSATVTGLDANGLVLQNNGGSDLAVTSDGTLTFPGTLASGAAYAVTVKTQPTLPALPFPAQQCLVTNANGTVGSANVNVAVTCAAPVFKYLYVSNDNSLSGYSVNASTGALTAVPGALFATGGRPSFGAPAGSFFYVTTPGDVVNSPSVLGFSVDATTGTLTELATSPYDLSVTPQPPGTSFQFVLNPSVHRSAAFGYVAAQLNPINAAKLFGATINSLTGELTEIVGNFPMDIGVSFAGFGYDSGGRVLFLTTHPLGGGTAEIRTFTVNSPSGVLTPVNSFPITGTTPSGPFVVPGDDFLLSLARTSSTVQVFRIEKTGGVPNGVLTPVGTPVSTGANSRPTFLAFNRRNNVFYVTNSNFGGATSSLATFRLDQSTGAVTAIGTPILTNDTNGSAVLHPTGRFLLQPRAGGFQRFTIDSTTFAPTLQPDISPTEVLGSFNVDFSGKYLYTTNVNLNTISSYRIDATTGAMTLVNTVPTGNQPRSVSAYGFQPQ